jgi:hypothetical protein
VENGCQPARVLQQVAGAQSQPAEAQIHHRRRARFSRHLAYQSTLGQQVERTTVRQEELGQIVANQGYPLPGNDSTYRYRTRDIKLSKVDPRGGDSVYIITKVRNFGLQAITSPFTLKFYDGIPSNGGSLIAETKVDTTIASRGYRNVRVPWYIPINQVVADLRIYAVIDQENAVTNEVHENNNLGWAPAIGYGSIVNVESDQIIPEKYVLYQSYPNPFNPSTTIKYSLPNSDNVSLKVFDILGREVAVLVNEYKTSGTYSIEFIASRFASGVYFYQLRSGEFVESKKMILMK